MRDPIPANGKSNRRGATRSLVSLETASIRTPRWYQKRDGDVSVAFRSVLATSGGQRGRRPIKAHHVKPDRRLPRQRPAFFRWPPVDMNLANRCTNGSMPTPFVLAWRLWTVRRGEPAAYSAVPEAKRWSRRCARPPWPN